MRALARSVRAAVLLASMILLVSCDAFYTIVLENDTNQELVVSALHNRVVLAPCWVQRVSGVGPAYGQPVPISATNASSGAVVFSITVREGPHGQPDPLFVRIPSQGPPVCPTPASTFTVLVGNQKRQPVEVWWQGSGAGLVEAGGDQEVGPFPGSWQDLHRVTIRDAGGKEKPADHYAWNLSYRIGDVPRIGILVTD